jgi:phosphinothricin acetyltransferase
MGLTVRAMTPEDWGRVSAIYREGIATGHSTFETEVPPYDWWAARHIDGCSIVACDGPVLVGWAALSPYSARPAYEGVAEASIYVGAGPSRGRGIGTLLLRSLIERSEARGFWTLQAGVFPENLASVALFKALGFREVGLRSKLGRMNGAWRDVLLLERRSERVGVD